MFGVLPFGNIQGTVLVRYTWNIVRYSNGTRYREDMIPPGIPLQRFERVPLTVLSSDTVPYLLAPILGITDQKLLTTSFQYEESLPTRSGSSTESVYNSSSFALLYKVTIC